MEKDEEKDIAEYLDAQDPALARIRTECYLLAYRLHIACMEQENTLLLEKIESFLADMDFPMDGFTSPANALLSIPSIKQWYYDQIRYLRFTFADVLSTLADPDDSRTDGRQTRYLH